MNAIEWIAQRREKTTLFRDRFGDTAGVGGVVALVAEDFPRALDALKAVLEEVDAMEQIASDHLVMDPTARSALLLAIRGVRSKVEAALAQP